MQTLNDIFCKKRTKSVKKVLVVYKKKAVPLQRFKSQYHGKSTIWTL